MSNNIAGKVIAITGASSGLGEAAARRLSSLGAVVVLGARRLDRINALADELVAQGGHAIAVPTDVTRSDDLKKLADTAVNVYGRIDVLINNAGVAPLSPLDRLRVDEWDQLIDVNLKGVLYGIAGALPHMIRQKAGHIINVSSIAAFRPTPGVTVYSATKQAVRTITEGLRLEVKPHDIRTTVICPGAVSTDLPSTVNDPDIAAAMVHAYAIAIPAESFANMVEFVIGQPNDVDINELVFRPTSQVS
ncbi:SDR family oxidoreductase [Burkholderia aenigmatica]|uniref:SDR family oxidoreductase n=1 Tax=Burkholderia cepacia complex TaxID=87882 RepID=UPI00158E1E78|nr:MULTISPECIES: SDR family oxidoreductase [Burkholderia cepacia complex]UKD16762.1 SDR family oxidoreductase [Burkholderia aenigmatica]